MLGINRILDDDINVDCADGRPGRLDTGMRSLKTVGVRRSAPAETLEEDPRQRRFRNPVGGLLRRPASVWSGLVLPSPGCGSREVNANAECLVGRTLAA